MVAALAKLSVDDWGTYGSYGLSETFTLASALPASAPAELRRDTSGRPLPGMQLRIVDPETGAPVRVLVTRDLALRPYTERSAP